MKRFRTIFILALIMSLILSMTVNVWAGERLVKHRLAVTTVVSTYDDLGASAIVEMVTSSAGDRMRQEAAMKNMELFGQQGLSTSEALCRMMNLRMFGQEAPAGPTAAGFRLSEVRSNKLGDQDYRYFATRLKQNVRDGYPLIIQAESSYFYAGEKGIRFFLLTGYLEAQDGSIRAFYFQDPSPKQQDAQWAGLKYVAPEDLMTAIVAAAVPLYIW